MLTATPTSKAKALQHYKKLAKVYGPKLGLKAKTRVAIDAWSHFGIDEDGTLVIYGNEKLEPREDAVFIHYLGHATIFSQGIPLLSVNFAFNKEQVKKWCGLSEEDFHRLCMTEYRKNFAYVSNRSADQFQDFFVWRLLQEKLGAEGRKLFRTYIDWFVKNAKPKSLMLLFELEKKETEMGFSSYVDLIDYFVSFWLLTKALGLKKEHRLIEIRYAALKKKKGFKKIFPPHIETDIKDLRLFFEDVQKKHPKALDVKIVEGNVEAIYESYYKLFWSPTGLTPVKLLFRYHKKN